MTCISTGAPVIKEKGTEPVNWVLVLKRPFDNKQRVHRTVPLQGGLPTEILPWSPSHY